MYEVDSKDKVVELTEFPQSSIGAPIPIVLASEHKVAVAYYLNDVPVDWDGLTIRMIGTDSNEPVAIVVFDICYAHYFGPPNDEAFSGHPLSNRGLKPYTSFEILNSSWIRKMESRNSIHPYHDMESFMKGKRHFVLAFHDSIFECVAQNFKIHINKGSMKEIIPKMGEFTL
ncbi:hypothetical protein ACG2LH_12900 [Zhouia sp. PK063]|uniref:hypothetical protein n=1 Tax=Zhouia sp. PK063 TaxID=3373602 RepID=UPI0037B96808